MKTRKDIEDLMTRVCAELQATREAGQKEYAHDEKNALRNFESLGVDLGIPREKVLWIFTKKHLDGILAWINGHRSQREDVRGRIKDAIVYLILLWAMADDQDRCRVFRDTRVGGKQECSFDVGHKGKHSFESEVDYNQRMVLE